MEFDRINHNRDVAERLQALLVNYKQQGGCNIYSMQALRRDFAVYIPFDHPDFHRHFSAFALQAIEIDRRYNRWCYPVGGQPPPPEMPIEQTLPFIFPPQANHGGPPVGQGAQDQHVGHDAQNQNLWGPVDTFLQQPAGTGNGQTEVRGTEEVARPRSRGVGVSRRRPNKRRRRSSGRRRSSSSSSDSSDGSIVYSFVPRNEESIKAAPPECQAIMRYRDEYKSNTLRQAVDSSVWRSSKPHKFPNALVWDLLQYNYIDLEKVNAGVIPDATEHFAKSLDKDAASKIRPRPFTESGEWRNAVSILRKSLSIAFPQAAASFKKYARHIKSLEIIFTRRVGSFFFLLHSLVRSEYAYTSFLPSSSCVNALDLPSCGRAYTLYLAPPPAPFNTGQLEGYHTIRRGDAQSFCDQTTPLLCRLREQGA